MGRDALDAVAAAAAELVAAAGGWNEMPLSARVTPLGPDACDPASERPPEPGVPPPDTEPGPDAAETRGVGSGICACEKTGRGWVCGRGLGADRSALYSIWNSMAVSTQRPCACDATNVICLQSTSIVSSSRNTDRTMSPSFQPSSPREKDGRRDSVRTIGAGLAVVDDALLLQLLLPPSAATVVAEPTIEPPPDAVLTCVGDRGLNDGWPLSGWAEWACVGVGVVEPGVSAPRGATSGATGQTILSSQKMRPALGPTLSPTKKRLAGWGDSTDGGASGMAVPAGRVVVMHAGSGGRCETRFCSSCWKHCWRTACWSGGKVKIWRGVVGVEFDAAEAECCDEDETERRRSGTGTATAGEQGVEGTGVDGPTSTRPSGVTNAAPCTAARTARVRFGCMEHMRLL